MTTWLLSPESFAPLAKQVFINGKVNGSDIGFDRIQFIPDKINPTSILIIETKPLKKVSIVLECTLNGHQMSGSWILENLRLMSLGTDEMKINAAILMKHSAKIERFAVGIDKNFNQAILIKLDTY